MQQITPQIETQQAQPEEFQIIFDKLEELKGTHNELFLFHSQIQNVLPKSIDEIKRIVEACNQQETVVTFTKA